jgi:hypothetical protein
VFAVSATTADGKRLIFACECGMIAPYGEWYKPTPGYVQIKGFGETGQIEVKEDKIYVEALKKQAEETNHNIKFIQSVCPFCARKEHETRGALQ